MSRNEDNNLPTLTRRQCLTMTSLLVAGVLSGSAATGKETATKEANSVAGRKPNAINVAIVLGAHNTLIDFAGPWEMFSSAAYAGGAFNVYSVGYTRTPVICDDGRGISGGHMSSMPISGLTVVPDFTFADAPQPHVTLVGAQVSNEAREKHTLEWIRHAAQKADLTASVCTGAYVLAKSGLLDGKSATTNRNAYDDFEKRFPQVKLMRGVRFVESGSVASSTGLTAGVDLSLHIVERYYGRKIAQDLADYEEWSSTGWIKA